MPAQPPPIPTITQPPPPAPTPPHSREKMVFIVGGLLIGFVVVAMGIFLGYREYTKRALPARENVSSVQKHEATHDAFKADAQPTDHSADAKAITTCLDQLNVALKVRDETGIKQRWDGMRIAAELQRLGDFKDVPSRSLPQLGDNILTGLIKGFVRIADQTIWDKHVVKKITYSASGDEAEVYDLSWRRVGQQQLIVKMRWWMRRTNNQWKLWDAEDLSVGLRTSTLLHIAAVQLNNGAAQSSLADVGPLINSVTKRLEQDDVEGALADLHKLDQSQVPAEMEALRLSTWAVYYLHIHDPKQSLMMCDKALATKQDCPLVFMLRATALNQLREFDKALEATKDWEDALGGDRDMYYQRSVALTGVGRQPDAAIALGQALDVDPDAPLLLGELARTLPNGQHDTLHARFAACSDKRGAFFEVINSLQINRDYEAMAKLLKDYAARPESAGDPEMVYFSAELKAHNKDYVGAENELRTILSAALTNKRQVYVTEYLTCAFLNGRSLAAYTVVDDPQVAFDTLARLLLEKPDHATLNLLIAAHRQRRPTHWCTDFYEGEIALANKDYRTADKCYARASEKASGEALAEIRINRVYARELAGESLSIYRELQPADKVFSQLASLLSNHNRLPELERVIAARLTDAPADPVALLWSARLPYMKQDYTSALQILNKHRATLLADEGNRYSCRSMIVRSLVRLKRFDQARAELTQLKKDEQEPWLSAVVECAAGNVSAGTALLEPLVQDDEETIEEMYDDPDLGTALKSPAFAAFRAKHPAPSTQPATQPTTAPIP